MQDEVAARRLALGEFIRTERSNRRLSLRRLSETSGISNPYLSQIERGLRKPSADVLQQIAKALDLPTEQLYVRAGILEAGDHADLIRHIRSDAFLTEEQKDALQRLYEEFRGANGMREEDTHPG